MRLFTFFIAIVVLFGSCNVKTSNSNKKIFKNTEWYLNNKLVLKNDSSICYTYYDTITKEYKNKKSFPLNINDTSIIYTRYQERGYYKDKHFFVTHLERLTDTVKYDLKYINKKPKLILYTSPFPVILCTKSNIDFPETNNHKQIKFVIVDYSIGDLIDKSLLKTRGIYNYPNYTIEDCEYIENKDITFKIIGYNTIYSIERKRIEDYRIKEIVDVVSNKLGVKAEYRPMRKWEEDSNYEYEFYRWTGSGVLINLSRNKYIGNDSYKTLISKDYWTLTYDDSYVQAILVETYKNGKPQSSIIN